MEFFKVKEEGIAFVFNWDNMHELKAALGLLQAYKLTIKDDNEKIEVLSNVEDMILTHICTIH